MGAVSVARAGVVAGGRCGVGAAGEAGGRGSPLGSAAVPEILGTTLVDAGAPAVAGALLDTAPLVEAARAAGVELRAGKLLVEGGRVTGTRGPVLLKLTVTRADLTGVTLSGRGLSLTTDLVRTGGGTLVVDRVEWTAPGGPLGRVFDVVLGRALALRLLEARSERLVRRAGELAGARVVVGAAITRGGRLLVQQRAFPADAEGRWELPGGRVDPGEDDRAALTRECREELGADVVVGDPVGPDVPLKPDLLLRVHTAELTPDSPEPTAIEHRALRWIAPTDLDALDWLPADRALIPALRALLT